MRSCTGFESKKPRASLFGVRRGASFSVRTFCAERCDIITRMGTNCVSQETAEAIAGSIREPAEVILEGIELAHIELERLMSENPSLSGLRNPDAVQQHVSLGRHLLRQHVASHQDEMGDWCLNQSVTANGAILIHNGLQHARLLHHRVSVGAPHAGINKSRVKYFQSSNAAQDPMLLEDEQRLLFLWNLDDSRSLRVVHTRTAGRFGRSPILDMDLTMRREEEDFGSFTFNGDLAQPLDSLDSLGIDFDELTGTDDEAR